MLMSLRYKLTGKLSPRQRTLHRHITMVTMEQIHVNLRTWPGFCTSLLSLVASLETSAEPPVLSPGSALEAELRRSSPGMEPEVAVAELSGPGAGTDADSPVTWSELGRSLEYEKEGRVKNRRTLTVTTSSSHINIQEEEEIIH